MGQLRDEIDEALTKANTLLTHTEEAVSEVERFRQNGWLNTKQREVLDTRLTAAGEVFDLATDMSDALDAVNTAAQTYKLEIEDEIAALTLDAERYRKIKNHNLIVVVEGAAPVGAEADEHLDLLESGKDRPTLLEQLETFMKSKKVKSLIEQACKGQDAVNAWSVFESTIQVANKRAKEK